MTILGEHYNVLDDGRRIILSRQIRRRRNQIAEAAATIAVAAIGLLAYWVFGA